MLDVKRKKSIKIRQTNLRRATHAHGTDLILIQPEDPAGLLCFLDMCDDALVKPLVRTTFPVPACANCRLDVVDKLGRKPNACGMHRDVISTLMAAPPLETSQRIRCRHVVVQTDRKASRAVSEELACLR
ncbi:unnamed protein product [Durusdinium trenchii]|uniref:Uncharacterized protein n=1 Tax=Durusdinium trenchii TaxID=1381693 RepID=A0ABP0KBZ8_9DINO